MRNVSMRLALLLFPLSAISPMAQTPAPSTIVKVIPGYPVTYPAGQIGGSSAQGLPANYISIPPAKEYYLDYQVWFENDFQWVKGGKLPGLVGGAHTSGCDPIVSNGWSARFMWHANGGAHFYYYHQNRANDCGDTRDFANGRTLKKNAWNRITERVVVNTPGQSNGLAQAWLNGEKILDIGGIKWRGNVAENVALVDNVSLQTFYGGSTNDWAPSSNTHARFSAFIVSTVLPDLTKPFDENPTVGILPGDRKAATVLSIKALPRDARLMDVQGRFLAQSPMSPSWVTVPLFTVAKSSTGTILAETFSGR